MLRLKAPTRVMMLPRQAMTSNRYSPADTFITDFCDTDAHWGPFLFVRPGRSQRLSANRCLVLAGLFGMPLGLVGGIFYGLVAHLLRRPTLPLLVFPLLMTLFYFVVCQLVLAPPWNRRAACLTNGRP